MGRENGKTGRCKSRASQLARFLHREGRKYCAVALCASLIAGSIGNMAIAADESTSNEHEFELSRVALYEALQEAVLEGNTLEKSFTFTGEAADTYDSLLDADGSLYELTPEIEDNDGALQLRIFARLDGEIELESAYDIDGSEEMIFLLTNSSDEEKRAVIHVDDKVTEEIKVAPKSAVLPGDLVNPYKSAAEAAGGPGAAANGETAAVDAGEAIVINGGGVSSGGGSGSGGGGGSSSGGKGGVETDGSDVEVLDPTEEVKENETSEESQKSEEFEKSEEIEESGISDVTEEPQDSEKDAGKDSDEAIDTNDSEADVTIDTDNSADSSKNEAITEDTDVSVDEPEKEEADSQDDGSSTDSEHAGGNVESNLSAAVSVRKTYRVTATPSNSDKDEDEASPSDATDSDAAKNRLDGMVYDAVCVENDSVVAFITTFEEMDISNLLALEASPSNAGRMHEADLGDMTVQVWVKNGVLPEDAELKVTRLGETAVQYQEAKEALDKAGTQYTGMMALDISFVVDGDQEIEPDGNVQVSIKVKQESLPEGVVPESLAVQHLKEDGADTKVQPVADATEKTSGNIKLKKEEAVVAAEFEVDSFSTFTITWGNDWRNYFKINVHYVNTDGTDIISLSSSNVIIENGQTITFDEIRIKDNFSFIYTGAYYGQYNGQKVISVTASEELSEYETILGSVQYVSNRKLTFNLVNGNDIVLERPYGTDKTIEANIYFVYKETESSGTPEEVVKKELTGEKKVVYNNADGTYDLTLSVSGAVKSITTVPKIDILLIVDKSGSMDGLRMEAVQTAIVDLTTEIEKKVTSRDLDVRYSLIAFAGNGQNDSTPGKNGYYGKYGDTSVLVDWESGTKANIDSAVKKIDPAGGTNYQAAINLGIKQLNKARKDAETYVIFLTDGLPTLSGNVGDTQYGTGDKQTYTYYANGKKITGDNQVNAETEIKGMGCSRFYAVGFGSDFVDVMGNEKDGAKNLTGLCDNVGKNVNGSKPIAERSLAGNAGDLKNVFQKIGAATTSILCEKVVITDTLSDNVYLVLEDGVPEKMLVTVRREDGSIVKQGENQVTLSATDQNEVATIKAVCMYNEKQQQQILLEFPTTYKLEAGFIYEVTTKIDATEAAYESYRVNKGYTDNADPDTGTHSNESGFYSNDRASVTYVYEGDDGEKEYNKPVVQIKPGTLKIIKKFVGLSANEIEKLKNTLTFEITKEWVDEKNVTHSVPDSSEGSKPDIIKLSDFERKLDGSFECVITGFSPNTTYSLTEKNADVAGYDLKASFNGDIKDCQTGTILKGETATVTVVNEYEKLMSMTIRKNVEGSMGNKATDYKFKMSVSRNGEDITKKIDTTLDSNSEFSLKDYATYKEEHTVFNLMKGDIVTVKEVGTESGYITTIKVEDDGTPNTSKNDREYSTGTEGIKNNTVVIFTNTKQVNPPTGIFTHKLPYMLMLAVAVLGMTGFTVADFKRRARRRRNQD